MKVKIRTEAYCGSLFRQLGLLADIKHSELDIYFYSEFYQNNLLDITTTYVAIILDS